MKGSVPCLGHEPAPAYKSCTVEVNTLLRTDQIPSLMHFYLFSSLKAFWSWDYKQLFYLVEMSTVNDQKLYIPDEKAALAMVAGDDDHKPAEPRSGPERRVSSSPGITTLTDSTKRFKLSSTSQGQALQER